MALPEFQLPLGPVTPHRRDELLRQRVDHAGADAVEAARGLVVALLELPAGVERGEDHLDGALLRLRMLVNRYAPPVICNRDRAAIVMKRHDDVRGVPVHRLVYGVVENLPDQVMEACRSDSADVHAGTFSDGLEAFEDCDVFRGIGRHSGIRFYRVLRGSARFYKVRSRCEIVAW